MKSLNYLLWDDAFSEAYFIFVKNPHYVYVWGLKNAEVSSISSAANVFNWCYMRLSREKHSSRIVFNFWFLVKMMLKPI